MFDLQVGTKFYFDDDLIEVVETNDNPYPCPLCFFRNKEDFIINYLNLNNNSLSCFNILKCSPEDRKDNKNIYFKKVEK